MTPQDQIYSVATKVGAAKLSYAIANRLTVKIRSMAVGDGNGAVVNPDSAWTALRREVHRSPLNSLIQHPDNPNWLVAELAIPPEIGGWTIREIGLYDEDGDLIFVGNHAEQYKPVQSQGSDETKVVRMVILVSDLASVTLKTDPSTVMATLAAVDAKLAAHVAAADPHSKYLLRSAVGADAGPLAWLGLAAGTASALTFSLASTEAKVVAYRPGQRFHFKAAAANTGAVTAKIGTLAALAVKKAGLTGLVDLASGDIKPGAVLELVYDGEVFQLVGGAGGSDLPLFAVQWWPSRASIPQGYAPADGQALSRSLYPDAWAGIQAGTVPTVAEAAWQSTATERGKYTAGDGSTTFRLPDYNGKASGSLGAVFLRGDGVLSAAVAGAIQQDALQNIAGETSAFAVGGTAPTDGTGAFRTVARGSVPSGIAGGGLWSSQSQSFDASRVARTAAETRPLNVTGCWIVKLFGAVTNPGSVNAAQLATDLAALSSRLSSLPFTKEFVSPAQSFVAGGLLTLAHGLGAAPKVITGELVCLVAEAGYSVGDVVYVGVELEIGASVHYGMAIRKTATDLVVRIGGNGMIVGNASTGVAMQASPANWRLILRAFA
ncbi:phage tail protein [Metapseudomonas otitidis]|uniref:phage tail-collar fiber domain-containing protein n=1 Tax=Metapseudomonas otitidis TaxID=319939 RepID=UPI0039FD45D2